MSDTTPFLTLSPSEARHVDQSCDRFEAAWKAGLQPRPEEYLGTAGEPVRSALLRQLLLVDWDYRRRAGGDPRAGDYRTCFPGDSTLIEDVSREMIVNPSPAVGRIDNPSHAGTGSARYDLVQEVGHGGIGVVFRGRDRLLGRELAVKVLREAYRDNPEARRRFTEEARVGSQLQHPAIVPVYELGYFDDRRPYFTMKLVEGHTFAMLLQDRTDAGQDLPRLLGIFAQVCQAMAYAHARGVVHRDLKPANVMVGEFGEVQVMDWGFAKVLAGDGTDAEVASCDAGAADRSEARPVNGRHGVSESGALMGTPAYMPPEQARGEGLLIDARADVFALGAILCEVLTGRAPYQGAHADAVCRQAAAGDLGEAHARLDACGADAALRELARRCLAAERPCRPPDAGVVARDLTAHLASAQERLRQAQLERAAAEARADEARAKAKAERRARRLTLALAAAAIVVLVLAGSGWWWHERVEQAQALRVAATDSKVEAALAESDDHLKRRDWSQARAAVTRARELLESGTGNHGKQRVDERLDDLDLVGELDELRYPQAEYDRGKSRVAWQTVLSRCGQVFARYGFSAGTDPAEAAARIMRRPAPVREVLVSGLEHWWLIARGRDAAVHAWLEAVLQSVDNDPWRARIRGAVVNRDRRLLEDLAGTTEAARQPKATVTSLARALIDLGACDAAVALLRPAQQRFPEDFWINLDLGQALLLRAPPDHAEALRFYSIARVLRPNQEVLLYLDLGGLLIKLKDWDGVIFVSRRALEQQPDLARAYTNLAIGLEQKGNWEQALAAFRKALELKPALATAHYHLGMAFFRRDQVDQAIASLERAVQLAPDDATTSFALGVAQDRRKDFDAALAALDKALELNPGNAEVHIQRGVVLKDQGRVDDAIAAYETAIRLDPMLDIAHSNLGTAWFLKGRWDRAVAACSRAVELNARSAANYYNLGMALRAHEDPDGAIAAYRKAIALDPNLAEAHCNVGGALQGQGRFAEALVAIKEGDRLGSAKPDWRYPSHQWLKQAQRLVALDAKLPGILDGSGKPATVTEQLEYAWVCKLKRLYGASARLHASAFQVEPARATASKFDHRYQAACVAAQAGSGQGQDAPEVDAPERTRLRKQALDWLRADLALWTDRLDRSPNSRSGAQSALQRWLHEKALAGIREPEELAKLPQSERSNYIRFWAGVQELLVRCLASPPHGESGHSLGQEGRGKGVTGSFRFVP